MEYTAYACYMEPNEILKNITTQTLWYFFAINECLCESYKIQLDKRHFPNEYTDISFLFQYYFAVCKYKPSETILLEGTFIIRCNVSPTKLREQCPTSSNRLDYTFCNLIRQSNKPVTYQHATVSGDLAETKLRMSFLSLRIEPTRQVWLIGQSTKTLFFFFSTPLTKLSLCVSHIFCTILRVKLVGLQ